MAEDNKMKLELDEGTMMVLGALRSNRAEDVLMLLDQDNVKKVLDNRKEVVEMLNEHRMLEVETESAIGVARAKAKMKIKLYDM